VVLEVRTLVANVSVDDTLMVGMKFMHASVMVDGHVHHCRVRIYGDEYESYVLAERLAIRDLNQMMPAGVEVL
jgi:hypothetical protein